MLLNYRTESGSERFFNGVAQATAPHYNAGGPYV
jgi:hypothetical protein